MRLMTERPYPSQCSFSVRAAGCGRSVHQDRGGKMPPRTRTMRGQVIWGYLVGNSKMLGGNAMKTIKIIAAAASLLILAAAPASAQTAKAALKSTDGKDVGTVELAQTPAGILLKVSVKGLPAGEHAFHVHAVGKCEPPFDTAGGHFNPGSKKHGLLASDGPHAGDMPNFHIPQSGELVVEVLNVAITLERGKAHSVFGPNGTAIVIHAGVDDYKTDPAGNAGRRIACGVIM
jgi:superoxide dismutase, Cu-Zn family